jgi:hypothetical protein
MSKAYFDSVMKNLPKNDSNYIEDPISLEEIKIPIKECKKNHDIIDYNKTNKEMNFIYMMDPNWVLIRITHRNTSKEEDLFKLFHIDTLELITKMEHHNIPFLPERLPEYLVEKYKENIAYLKYYENYIPCDNTLRSTFIDFLTNNGKLTEKELILLSKLKINDIDDVFYKSNNISNYMEYRQLSIQELKNKEDGTWLIRQSSIEDDYKSCKFARVITTIIDNNFVFLLVIHIAGCGYYLNPLNTTRGQNINEINYNTAEYYSPSIINIFLYLADKKFIVLEKYNKNKNLDTKDIKKFYVNM